MSIPPLVCSTPPPPEICVDDKDPDDFDLQYNLSQEDYDERYDSELSPYTHFESIPKPSNNESLPAVGQNEANEQLPNNMKDCIEFVSPICESQIDDTSGKHLKSNILVKNEESENLEEDCNIEDLDLKLDDSNVNTELPKDIENEITEKEIVHETTSSRNFSNLTKEIETETQSEIINYLQDDLNSLDHVKDTPVSVELQSKGTSEEKIDEDGPLCDKYEDSLTKDSVADTIADEISSINKNIETANEVNDDFSEFEDFQFQTCDNKPAAIIDNFENPWDCQQTDENDFGNFSACFDQHMNNSCMVESQNQNSSQCDGDDDFDDFNEFKSSVEQSEGSGTNEKEQRPVFDVNSSDNEAQLYERINKVIIELFPNDISEPESEIEGNLDGHLGETWGHLLETDVRQPYRVNWNNSIGQKTLLKSLCIDSRNILFAPKWNYMPKYANNLSTAPLQPQKQSKISSLQQSDNAEAEKSTAKPSTAWSDPSDIHEPCKTDNRSLSTVPTDLDVFEATSTSNEGKVYSSTLNVQPLRQINLPDTHIFTPCDSETPRSKTIHYDSNPTILLPNSAVDDTSQSKTDLAPTDISNNEHTNIKVKDDDYWEFQDFKGVTTASVQNNTEEKKGPNPIITMAAQVMQPIKAEPSMPVLNWPDPGEVKETFNDFTDFVSSTTSWANDTSNNVVSTSIVSQQITSTPAPALPINFNSTAEDVIHNVKMSNPTVEDVFHNVKSVIDDGQILNDDFDTFQSALPAEGPIKTNNQKFMAKTVSITTGNVNSNRVERTLTPPPLSSNTMTHIMKIEKNIVTQASVPPTVANILQPTLANSHSSNYSQQKYGQILQPLSLENYSQINWPSPGIDLQDLSRFNPVETLQSLKSDLSVNSFNKGKSPVHSQKTVNQSSDDDWGDFVSSKPPPQMLPKKSPAFGDDDEWTDFISSPSVKSQNGLNTISLNVHTSFNNPKSSNTSKLKQNKAISVDIPSLNYITPKSTSSKSYNDKQFQNL